MDLISILKFIGGLALLLGGAELLIRGAVSIAERLHIPQLIIGLTIVGFGTSSPELAVSVRSAVENHADIAFGNVVGSNIFNILFILGISSLISPVKISRQLIIWDVPLMIGISLLTAFLVQDLNISQREGWALCCMLVGYVWVSIQIARKAKKFAEGSLVEARSQSTMRLPTAVCAISLGLYLLVTGATFIVEGAIQVARLLGASELVISLTIVAAGTSLPEITTSILSSVKGKQDLSVGNVIGSNIFNLLGVLGLSAVCSTNGLSVPQAAINFDLLIMVATALACAPIFFTGQSISRWEGALFIGYYIAYTVYLILFSTDHSVLPAYSKILGVFCIPMTVLGLLISVGIQIRNKRLNANLNQL